MVYKAKDTWHEGTPKTPAPATAETKIVALKKCYAHHTASDGMSVTTLREIAALRICAEHPNIVTLLDIAVSQPQQGKTKLSSGHVFLVFEHCQYDLAQLLDTYQQYRQQQQQHQHQHYHRRGRRRHDPSVVLPVSPFTAPQIQILLYQLVHAIAYCHAHNVLHRDLKTSNVLYTVGSSTTPGGGAGPPPSLKVCDFGLSRTNPNACPPTTTMLHSASCGSIHTNTTTNSGNTTYDNNDTILMTPNVVSLWYRPPELLLPRLEEPKTKRDHRTMMQKTEEAIPNGTTNRREARTTTTQRKHPNYATKARSSSSPPAAASSSSRQPRRHPNIVGRYSFPIDMYVRYVEDCTVSFCVVLFLIELSIIIIII